MEWNNMIKAGAGALSGALAYIFGAWDTLMIGLVIVVALDYVTGLINAGVQGKISSKAGFSGIIKKLLIFALVALGALLDRVVPGLNGALRAAVCGFYIANEGISVLENCGAMGLPLPEMLKRALETLRKQSEEE